MMMTMTGSRRRRARYLENKGRKIAEAVQRKAARPTPEEKQQKEAKKQEEKLEKTAQREAKRQEQELEKERKSKKRAKRLPLI